MNCLSCGSPELIQRWKTFRDGTRHIEEVCNGCGIWQRWVPQTHPSGAPTKESLDALPEPPSDDDRQGGLW